MAENSIPQGVNLDDLDGKGIYMRPSTNPTSTNIVINMAEEAPSESDDDEASDDDDAPLTPQAHAEAAYWHAHALMRAANEVRAENRRTERRLASQEHVAIEVATLAQESIKEDARELIFWPFALVLMGASFIFKALGWDSMHYALLCGSALIVIADWFYTLHLTRLRLRVGRQLHTLRALMGDADAV